VPEPSDWGAWTKGATGWQPHWTTFPEASQPCHEFISCVTARKGAGGCSWMQLDDAAAPKNYVAV